MHAHAAYEESEYVVSREREIFVGEHHWRAGTGCFVLAPRRARHTMRTIGTTPSRRLHFFSPAGMDQYFVERERLREAGASADELRALSARHGATQVDPDGAAGEPYASVPRGDRDGFIVTGGATRNP